MAISLLAIAGCTVQEPGVQATRSRQNESRNIVVNNPPTDTTPDTTPDGSTDSTPDDTSAAPSDTTPIPVQEGVINFGANKTPRDYDGYLTAAFSDIEAFWAQQFPTVYGSELTPLSGGIYAAYPERSEPIPGCGTPETTYRDIEDNAFYCVDGDFIAYDDAELLPQLVEQLGQGAVAVVLAHEFGHMVQARADEANQPTILKEQQADCFAGAWAAHVARGESDVINFSDDDIRGGLIAMIQVRDPLELGGQIDESSHGTGFDRVGAFQDGFTGGPERCKTFFTEGRENQLINIPFDPSEPSGNLPLVDPNPDSTIGPVDVVTLLPKDLDRFWTAQLATSNLTLTPPTLKLFTPDGADQPTCDGLDSSDFDQNIVYCPASNTIFADQDWAAKDIADPLLGDMSIGYLIAHGYSEIVQGLLGSKLTNAARALADDCLTGAWIRDDLPPQPEGRPLYLSAGDLDEAIVTAIVRGDRSSDADFNGTAFEKVDAFRSGVLGGMQSCQGRISS